MERLACPLNLAQVIASTTALMATARIAIEAVSAVIRPAHQYSGLSALLARLEAGGIALRFSIGIGKISCRDKKEPDERQNQISNASYAHKRT
jgi:hypothetical protein